MTHSNTGSQPDDTGSSADLPDRSGDGDVLNFDALMDQVREDVRRHSALTETGDGTSSGESRADSQSLSGPSTAEVLQRVRAEIAHRRSQMPAEASEGGEHVAAPLHPPLWQPAEPRLGVKSEYKLWELLRFDDADFVDTAYKALLRRQPDPAGRGSYLRALRAGSVGKVEILGSIRFSDEGRKCGVHVDGLLLPYKLHQWRHRRVIGSFLGFVMGVVRLPHFALRLQAMEANAARESQEVGRSLNALDGEVHALRGELTQSILARVDALRTLAVRLEAAEGAIESQADGLRREHDEAVARHRELVEKLRAGAEEQGQRHHDLTEKLRAGAEEQGQLHHEMTDRLATLDQSLTGKDEDWRAGHAEHAQRLLEDAKRFAAHDAAIARLNDQASSDQRNVRALLDRMTVFLGHATRLQRAQGDDAPATEPPLESHYASFEDSFRGSREDIKQRAAPYLKTLENAGIGPGAGLVIDLGSGRGEWLEVLTAHGYACRGVDLNHGILEASRALGHDVVETDALGYLRILQDGSVAAVTSMHLVEHLPHPVLIELLDEALRVLMPGGVLILETPNPENVLVGACLFYMDPTHLHPIPPPLLQWLVKSRGFSEALIERLSEHRGKPDLVPVSDEVPAARQINQMIEWFTAPSDYAVIGQKPR